MGDPESSNDDTVEEVLSPTEFTCFFAASLRLASPKTQIEVTGELELETGDGNNQQRKAFLDNAYSVYLSNPDARDEIIDGFVASHLDLINEGVSEQIDLKRVVPVVKDKAWVAGLAQSLAGHQKEGDSEIPVPIHEALNSELDVVYAEDSPHNIRYLNQTNLEALALDVAALRARAVENLSSLLEDQVTVHGGEGVYLISVGGNYEASFLLFDEFWDSETLEVDGDYVVAIPTRDLLLVTGSKHAEGIARVRHVAGEASNNAAYSLTPVLFIRAEGNFEVFEG
jgi:uncharacterized protein YtpQ (UPF0354 family)